MTGEGTLRILTPAASAQEAAAIVAAVERFRRDTAPALPPAPPSHPSAWKRAALVEGVARQPDLTR